MQKLDTVVVVFKLRFSEINFFDSSDWMLNSLNKMLPQNKSCSPHIYNIGQLLEGQGEKVVTRRTGNGALFKLQYLAIIKRLQSNI